MIEHQHQVGKNTATPCCKRAQLAKSMLNEKNWRSQTFTPSTRHIFRFKIEIQIHSSSKQHCPIFVRVLTNAKHADA